MPGNLARGSEELSREPSGYSIICQNPSTLAYRLPESVNGVDAKLDRIPSSLRFERITSPDFAACGSISQSGLFFSGTGVHQCAGYCCAPRHSARDIAISATVAILKVTISFIT